jgi:CRISPR-associated protein Cas2
MELLVAYDISTVTAEGERRLRRVAQACEGFGQRVQKSVFECTLSPAKLEMLLHRVSREMDLREDSLRVYRLREPYERYVRKLGITPQFDMRKALVL